MVRFGKCFKMYYYALFYQLFVFSSKIPIQKVRVLRLKRRQPPGTEEKGGRNQRLEQVRVNTRIDETG